jgi:hypothetical protein
MLCNTIIKTYVIEITKVKNNGEKKDDQTQFMPWISSSNFELLSNNEIKIWNFHKCQTLKQYKKIIPIIKHNPCKYE